MKMLRNLMICSTMILISACGNGGGDSSALPESRTDLSTWVRGQLARTSLTAEPVEINQLDFVFRGDPNDVNAFDDLF